MTIVDVKKKKKKDSCEYGCDDCHRKYNGWGISMRISHCIAKEILESIGE